MNEQGAAAALRAAAAGDDQKLSELGIRLAQQEGIAGRYLAEDLRDVARDAAIDGGDGGLDRLLTSLRNRPDSMLAAFFPGSEAPKRFELAGATIGPACELAPLAPPRASTIWPDDATTLTILTRDPSQGRLGAVTTSAWLQTVLGAIGLAAYARSGKIAPLARCPAMGTALYFSAPTAEPEAVERVALAAPGPTPVAELAEIIADTDSQSLIADATARDPKDLAQKRLTLAARWLQLAASTISAPDAFVALGIALETIVGDSNISAVVERVTERSAVFLARSAPREERADVYWDEVKRARKLYDVRSIAAHGQFDPSSDKSRKFGDASREDFHHLVLDVALGFREHTRARNIRDTDDFTAWWKRAKLEGMFT